VAAGIHAGPTVEPTTDGPVVWGFFGSPLNAGDVTLTPFATGVGGTFSGSWDAPEGNGTTLGAQFDNLLQGHAYIDFRTSQFGDGEIRGNIVAVPEPGPYQLLLGGLALLACVPQLRSGQTSWRRLCRAAAPPSNRDREPGERHRAPARAVSMHT
jgi:hypothetical protein